MQDMVHGKSNIEHWTLPCFAPFRVILGIENALWLNISG